LPAAAKFYLPPKQPEADRLAYSPFQAAGHRAESAYRLLTRRVPLALMPEPPLPACSYQNLDLFFQSY